jgi:branched-chain amino acid aminotransferase
MLFNGNVVDPKTSMPSVHNRAFLFADGCFESMRWTDGRIPLLSLHLARLKDALVTFGMDIPEGLNLTNLEASLQAWSQQWPWSGDVRIRLTAFREGAGAYAPSTDGVSWVATGASLSEVGFRLPGKGLAVDVYQDAVKHASPWAKYKTLAATLYVQAARHASQQGWGDALILNADQHLIESSRSNLFVVSNGVLYTPGLEAGCVGGIMRSVAIQTAMNHGMKVYECALTPQTLLQADEVFLTNAVRGIEWVASYKTKRYFHATSEKLTAWIQEDWCAPIIEGEPSGPTTHTEGLPQG